MIDYPGIKLGKYLDQILDREGRESKAKACIGVRFHGGKDDATAEGIGSGNIVIRGPAGGGKSTLAMQIVYRGARQEEEARRVASTYISLEEPREGVIAKFGSFGWDDCLLKLDQSLPVDDVSSPEQLANSLRSLLDPGFQGSEKKPKVLLLDLTPRSLSRDDQDKVFEERFAQLKRLVEAAKSVNQESANRERVNQESVKQETSCWFPLICIDSLNAMGIAPDDRERLARVFGLFKQNRILGVFLVEAGEDTPFDSTMADVVISLSSREEHGHFMRYLEVEKSRYRPQVYGRQPFKIIPRNP